MFRLFAACVVMGLLPLPSFASIIAADSASDPAYVSGFSPGANGGFGFQPWNEDNALGGGTYLENSGRQVDAGPSFAIYSGDAGYAMDRPLTTPLSQGAFSVIVRNDEDNSTGFCGINLKTTAGPLLGSGEILSIGMIPSFGNSVIVASGASQQTVAPTSANPDLRGDVLEYMVDWNTDAGTYDLTVNDLSSASSASTSGSLSATGQPVASFGIGNFNSGSFQNLIFNDPTVSTVPEPGCLLLVGAAGFTLLTRRPKRG